MRSYSHYEKNTTFMQRLVFGLLIGGVVFTAAPIALVYPTVVTPVIDAWSSRNWVATEGQVINSSVDRTWVNNSSTSSTTNRGTFVYKVSASYQYTYAGNSYYGSRIGLMDVSDAIPAWHQNWHTYLQRAKSKKTPITVYVNPDNPYESLLDRGIRWTRMVGNILIAALFVSIGLFIMYSMISFKPKNQQ